MSITATQDVTWAILAPSGLGGIADSRTIQWSINEFQLALAGTQVVTWEIGTTDETIDLEMTGAPTGLVGTVSVEIVAADGTTVVYPTTTAGIVESPAGTGRYVATVTRPAAGEYFVIWSDGTTTIQTGLTVREIIVSTLQTPIRVTTFADYSIKAGDTEPGLLVTFRNAGGLPVDLTGAEGVTASVLRKDAALPIIVARDTTIVDPPTTGQVLLEWQTGDTDTPGVHAAEFAIAWPEDGRTTTPTKATYRFTIEPAGI